MTTVIVVDDHPVFRKGLIALLRASDIEVIAEAGSGAEAIDAVVLAQPDLLLMDLGMPGMSGIVATEQIVARYPAVRVLVISLFDDEQSVQSALAAGASGYVLKDSSPEQILAAVAAVSMGARWFGTGVPMPRSGAAPAASPTLSVFTAREASIAELVGKGLSNSAIAERLSLSSKTVANYVSIVLLKLGADDRRAAIEILRGDHR